ncbi:DUF6206 family protein [Streptomyces flavofungini]|uniref:Uncharacterized protein n=1 Tax=Streptomyces flavofungini TaxID=68200 RepID=A0ABS0X1S1_9ACTN|nr:DUF6206 family protein [Streptomyces flavofungini]MBJ3807138.1 hypothetical protein [Streptomyces flavofungini]GHC74798.1 hypothetical protein GCM10010349_53490 [Streptomyces flavofungini]
MTLTVPHTALARLEEQVQDALRRADDSALDVLGYGEITLVLRLRADGDSFACKRLPVFPDRDRFERYRDSLDVYLRRLAERGLTVAPTEVWHTTGPRGRITAYCVQRELPPERLCSRLLHTEGEAWAKSFFARFLDRVDAAVHPTLGLDAQASNWIDVDGELTYLDVSTPLMRDERRRELLDVRLFFTSLPWLLRDAVRVTMATSIFDKFYETRGVLLDFLGNLHKEHLDTLIPVFLEQANARLAEPITAADVASYYRGDARMWELIQRLRAADRRWQRTVRRKPYPFLLPPPVDR